MAYDVEPGFEIPKRPGNRKRIDYDYPFRKMAVGDSFFMPISVDQMKVMDGKKSSMYQLKVNTIRAQAYRFRDVIRPGFKIVVRRRLQHEDSENGLRVWRTA